MSIQGSVNQMIASIGATGYAIHQKRAQESLRQHQMEVEAVRNARAEQRIAIQQRAMDLRQEAIESKERMHKKDIAVERRKLRLREAAAKGPSDESLLKEAGVNFNNPLIAAQLREQGIKIGGKK